jgi:hypothetical protein
MIFWVFLENALDQKSHKRKVTCHNKALVMSKISGTLYPVHDIPNNEEGKRKQGKEFQWKNKNSFTANIRLQI